MVTVPHTVQLLTGAVWNYVWLAMLSWMTLELLNLLPDAQMMPDEKVAQHQDRAHILGRGPSSLGVHQLFVSQPP